MNVFTRKGRALLLLTAAVIVGVVCVSYGQTRPAELVGHWLYLNGSKKGPKKNMELFKDGTGVSDGGTITWKVENKRFIIQSATIGVACEYKVSGSRLILTYDDNVSADFVNKEAKAKEIEKLSSYFTDSRNGQKYRVVKIGGKSWMAQNLNYPTGNSWCFDDDESKCQQYGRLYDWNTAKTACPSGWHLPSREEWNNLVTAAGEGLKSVTGWREGGIGTDEFGFTALPGGARHIDEAFRYVGIVGDWWTATECTECLTGVYSRSMGTRSSEMYESDMNGKISGLSVRCVQN